MKSAISPPTSATLVPNNPRTASSIFNPLVKVAAHFEFARTFNDSKPLEIFSNADVLSPEARSLIASEMSLIIDTKPDDFVSSPFPNRLSNNSPKISFMFFTNSEFIIVSKRFLMASAAFCIPFARRSNPAFISLLLKIKS